MTHPTSKKITLADLDLQGYSLAERVHGIALLQDPVRADILRYIAADYERFRAALERVCKPHDGNHIYLASCDACHVVQISSEALSGDSSAPETSPQWTCSCGHVNTTQKLFTDRCNHCGEHRGSVEETSEQT